MKMNGGSPRSDALTKRHPPTHHHAEIIKVVQPEIMLRFGTVTPERLLPCTSF
jgi:hypothetical protein